ncbi:hypothetical protein F8388_027300 [Cannabis sativa]|uniref:RNase H type-1 domain-containing protein n=1 Tax=Cannabis sativa TaxID=3483 RepID=A0A7J6FPQ6_CANSA|nr:hypothetical protein F8388_027300 [Cannabis sativa]KAF4399541.1 hypothetical protein G4B88_022624 [Cannabis sativa]
MVLRFRGKTKKISCAVAAVIRDSAGCLVAAETGFQHGYGSVLLFECMAIRLGVRLVQRMQAKPFIITSNNLITAVNNLQSRQAPRA